MYVFKLERTTKNYDVYVLVGGIGHIYNPKTPNPRETIILVEQKEAPLA